MDTCLSNTTSTKRRSYIRRSLDQRTMKLRCMRRRDDVSTKRSKLISYLPQFNVACKEMVFYCFESLGDYFFDRRLSHRPSNTRPSWITASQGNQIYPLFVTWRTGLEHNLRGCVGTFSPIRLSSGLREYAINSATKDNRFKPITKEEFPSLSCAVSILTDFEPANGYLDWEIGKHGLRVEFKTDKGYKTATYLPEVPHEQGWNHTQTIESLIRKAGYKGFIDDHLKKSLKIVRYKSEKISCNYKDYIKASKVDKKA